MRIDPSTLDLKEKVVFINKLLRLLRVVETSDSAL